MELRRVSNPNVTDIQPFIREPIELLLTPSQIFFMCPEAIGHTKSPIFSCESFRALDRTLGSA